MVITQRLCRVKTNEPKNLCHVPHKITFHKDPFPKRNPTISQPYHTPRPYVKYDKYTSVQALT
jgi:hypothetical protein